MSSWNEDDNVNLRAIEFQQASNEKTPEGPRKSTGLGGAIASGCFVNSAENSLRSSSYSRFGSNNRAAGSLKNTAHTAVPVVPVRSLSQDSASKKTPLPKPGFSLSVNNTPLPVNTTSINSTPRKSPDNFPTETLKSIGDSRHNAPSSTRQQLMSLTAGAERVNQGPSKSRTIMSTKNSLVDMSPPTQVATQKIGKAEPVKLAKKKDKEVVDLLDDDDNDHNDSENVSSQIIAKQYGKNKTSLLSALNGGNNPSVIHRDYVDGYQEGSMEWYEASHIYLGMKMHHSEMRSQRMCLCINSGCIELSLTPETTDDLDAPSSAVASLQMLKEVIPLRSIQRIQCGTDNTKIDPVGDGEEAFIAIEVKPDCHLLTIPVGPHCPLDPTLTTVPKTNPAKYILIVTTFQIVNRVQLLLRKFPDWSALYTPPKHRNIISTGCFAAHKFPEDRQKAMQNLTRSSARKSRRKQRDTAVIDFTDPADCIVHVVYPTEIDALDAITIYTGDLRRLQPCEYLNDNLIDLKIKHMINGLDEAKRARVHAFSCLFYGKLTEISGKDHKAAHSLVARWTKSLNLFDLDFIIFPINLTFHWSVCFLTNPGLLLTKMNDCLANGGVIDVDVVPSTPSQHTPRGGGSGSRPVTPAVTDGAGEGEQQPVEDCRLLFMDSLGMHQSATIAKNIRNYLFHEWETRVRSGRTFMAKNDENTEVKSVPSASSEDKTAVETPVSFDADKALKVFSDHIKHYKCIVPTQPNGYDCGVYVIKYVQMVLDTWPTAYLNRTNKKGQYCDAKINPEAFKQSDVDDERQNILALLDSLHIEWKEVREKYKAEHGEDPAENDVPQSPGFHAVPDPAMERQRAALVETESDHHHHHQQQQQQQQQQVDIELNIMEKSSDEDIDDDDEELEGSGDSNRMYTASDGISTASELEEKYRLSRDMHIESSAEIPDSLNNDFNPTAPSVADSSNAGEVRMEVDSNVDSTVPTSTVNEDDEDMDRLAKRNKRRKLYF